MSAFDASKESILQNLDAGVDFSFKGSIDAPIVELVHFLNRLQDYFTTSSCSGRVSVFRSGLTAKQIRWILVKHRLFTKSELLGAIQCIDPADTDFADSLVTLKCEAFILHINCRDLESAKSLHNIATLCGFRESGIKLGNKKIILAVRTTANGMELPIAKGSDLLVSDSYLNLIISECNARLASNFSRIDKFLSELKKHYTWPVLHVLNAAPSGENSIRRWGHTVSMGGGTGSTKAEVGALVVGGYGVAEGNESDKSQRGLSAISMTGDKVEPLSFVEASMHAASAAVKLSNSNSSLSLLVVSGGRTSPAAALSCLRLFNTEQSYVTVPFAVSGEEPSSRWGHSLTLVLANPSRCSFLLYGGRDATSVLGDAHLLHIELTANSVLCSWEKLHLQQDLSQVQLERFFHAACTTLNVFPVDDSQNQEYNMVVVHGGLLAMDDPVTCGKGFIIDPNSSTLTLLVEETFKIAAGNAENQESGEAGAANGKESKEVGLKDVRRFGHTLTAVGAKTLLLIGGASFQSSFNNTSDVDTVANNETLALDLFIDVQGRYRGSFRPVTLSGAVQSAVLSDAPSLPDQTSRVHHQAAYNPVSGVLDVIGGGAMTLAFGAHFSPSLRVQVCTNANTPLSTNGTDNAISSRSASVGGRTSHATSASDKSFLANFAQAEKIQDCTVVFAPASSVRSVKVYLESLKYLDKTRSIAKVEPSVLSNSFASIVPLRLSLVAPFVVEQVSSAEATELEQTTFATGSWMAIPITSQLEALLRGDSASALLAELLKHFAPLESFLLGQYSARISKRTQVNSAQKAVEFLQALSSHHRLPVQASGGALASRFEVVGDVLMLPEQYLTGPQWETILGLETTSSPVGVTTSVAETEDVAQYRRQVFGTLAQCFGLQRVARKAEIDSGPKRESKVRILHPVLGMPTTTGPGSPGWVTVYENKIGFSFDITRVMFCSGNVTERMRMGRQASQGNVVVDFYCGIGYYTVPLLVHGGARHVHACEWNPNSVLALRENLRRAGVSERCTVYEGDNKISAESLHDLADRVNLGLLPSSVTGWELAARALKPTGGMIHVHENVLESILDTWVEETRQTFEAMLKACGKELKVSIVHLERVKSYAPRVYHVVLDLSCVE